MKLFDYTNGKKTSLLKNVRLPDSFHGAVIKLGEQAHKVRFPQHDVSFACSAGFLDGKNNVTHIKPERLLELGVEAVTYCSGEWDGVWQWHVTATEAWVRKAHKKGWITLQQWDFS